jgi:hypothetical protein
MKVKLLLLAGVAVLGSLMPMAKADDWDQKTIFSFSGPVEIPGQVLAAGTYVFKLADSSSDRNIVQVFNRDESHLYGTFLAIADYRLQPADKPIITFDERPVGTPEAVKAWFYPGQNYGHDFVYPKPKAVALAKANNAPVPSMPAPLKAQKPSEQEVEIAEVFELQPAPAPDPPAQLPATASDLPLIGILGVLSLTAVLGLRLATAKTH